MSNFNSSHSKYIYKRISDLTLYIYNMLLWKPEKNIFIRAYITCNIEKREKKLTQELTASDSNL